MIDWSHHEGNCEVYIEVYDTIAVLGIWDQNIGS